MEVLTLISVGLWAALMVAAVLGYGSFTINGRLIEHRGIRLLMAIGFFPALGLIFSIMGFVGWFLLLPFVQFWNYLF